MSSVQRVLSEWDGTPARCKNKARHGCLFSPYLGNHIYGASVVVSSGLSLDGKRCPLAEQQGRGTASMPYRSHSVRGWTSSDPDPGHAISGASLFFFFFERIKCYSLVWHEKAHSARACLAAGDATVLPPQVSLSNFCPVPDRILDQKCSIPVS